MADNVQNITVNYKFNTAEVTAAESTLAKANAASNALQASAGKAGSAINTGFKQGNASILAMQNSLVRLKTQIEVSTNPASTAKLAGEYRRLKTELDAATKAAFNLGNAQKSAGGGAQSLSTQLGGLVNAARAVVTVGLVKEVVSIAINMAKLAGNVEGVERAFKRAFPNSVALLNRLKDATHGTVTEVELMQKTLQATNLGVAVEQLPELFEFAAARAQQTGESVDYLVDSIVRGIGRKSPLILDNLGISAIRLKEKFNGASLEAQSIGDVTKAVAEIAKEEMGKMGGYTETAATKVSQLSTAWEELRVQLAKKTEVGTSGITSFLTASLEGLKSLITSNKELFLIEARRLGSADALRVVESKSFKELGDNQQKKFDFIQQEINSRVQLTGRYNDNLAKLKEERALLEDKNPYDKKIESLTKSIKSYNDNKVVLNLTILALKEYLAAIDLTTKAEAQSITSIKTLKDQMTDLQKLREEATSINDTAALDRLQREIILLDDRILKISDNVKWQKQWNRESEETKLAEMNLAQETEVLGHIIDGLTDKFGNLVAKAPSFEDSMKEIEESVKEVAEVIEMTTGKEFVIRLRLGLQGKGGETSDAQKFVNEELKKIQDAIPDMIGDQAHSAIDAEVSEYKQRLANLEEFYDHQLDLAGNNERAKEQIRIKQERETKKLRDELARKEKQAARSHVYIDMAVGIAKALATYPWPYSLIPAAFVAAQGAAQLSIIGRQPSSFAKGVIDLQGPGTATSDSIPANLSKGESVMTAWETRMSGDVLRDIRAKKLDNKSLRDLKQKDRAPIIMQADNSDIIKAIKEIRFPDIIEQANIAYRVTKYTEEYNKRVRASTMSGR